MELDKIIFQIKEVIIESLELKIEPNDIDDNELLFNSHLGLDSVGTLVLVEALEDEFDIEVEDEELTPELFESVKSLEKYLKAKLNSQEINNFD